MDRYLAFIKNKHFIIGGVGIAATQISKTIEGVEVYGMGSESKKEKAIELGVDTYFSNENFKAEVGGERFDVIIANQSGDLFNYLQDLLKPLGRIIILGKGLLSICYFCFSICLDSRYIALQQIKHITKFIQ